MILYLSYFFLSPIIFFKTVFLTGERLFFFISLFCKRHRFWKSCVEKIIWYPVSKHLRLREVIGSPVGQHFAQHNIVIHGRECWRPSDYIRSCCLQELSENVFMFTLNHTFCSIIVIFSDKLKLIVRFWFAASLYFRV